MLGSPTKKFVEAGQGGLESCVVVSGDLVGDKVAAVVVVVVVVVRPSHQRSVQHLFMVVRINDPSLPGEIKEKDEENDCFQLRAVQPVDWVLGC